MIGVSVNEGEGGGRTDRREIITELEEYRANTSYSMSGESPLIPPLLEKKKGAWFRN